MISKSNFILTIACLISCSAAVKAFDLCADSAYIDICADLWEKSYLIDGNARLNWYEAERFCLRQNGYLATLQSYDNIKAVSNYLVSKGYLNGDQKFWLGASDLGSKGKIFSVGTGKSLPYTRWASGQPDTSRNENCVALTKQNNEFVMTTADCNSQLRYVCELQEKPNASKKLVFSYKYV